MTPRCWRRAPQGFTPTKPGGGCCAWPRGRCSTAVDGAARYPAGRSLPRPDAQRLRAHIRPLDLAAFTRDVRDRGGQDDAVAKMEFHSPADVDHVRLEGVRASRAGERSAAEPRESLTAADQYVAGLRPEHPQLVNAVASAHDKPLEAAA